MAAPTPSYLNMNPYGTDSGPAYASYPTFNQQQQGSMPSGNYTVEAGQPFHPNYLPGYSPGRDNTSSGMGQMLSQINVNQQGLNAYRQNALRTGPSTWANLAGEQQDQLAMTQRNQAALQSGSAGAEAQSQLAQSGGLTGGARERIARDAGRNNLSMQQGVNHDLNANKLQIGVNDEQNRIQQLGALPGMENANAQTPLQKAQLMGQAGQFDIANQAAEAGRQNDFNLGQYHEQMAGWAAGKQANAIGQSGKK